MRPALKFCCQASNKTKRMKQNAPLLPRHLTYLEPINPTNTMSQSIPES